MKAIVTGQTKDKHRLVGEKQDYAVLVLSVWRLVAMRTGRFLLHPIHSSSLAPR